MMEEARHREDLQYDEYLSEQYFRNRTKSRFPVDDEQPEPSREDIVSGKVCPYCYQKTECVDSAEVYRRSYGPIHICRPCQAWVGVHKGSTVALGRLANAELRKLKQSVHAKFDPIWKQGHHDRNGAYAWLALRMEIHVEQCHIGMFNEKECWLALGLLEEWEGTTTDLK
jgi:hypothetical protein